MRLISSLAAAAGVLADQAADRLDAWVEHNASADDTPGETSLGFTVPTGPASKGVDVKGLTGEQRARWLAEVKERLDVSTGGPWCTEERDNPTGRIISPYGVIATGVTREADRDLIEGARADLFGLIALAEYDDQIIEALQYAARHQTERRNIAERELTGMHERERQVDKVVAAWDTKRAGLNGYDGTIDPETPAGRVVELLHELCKARPVPNRTIEARTAALTAIENNLTEHNIDIGEGDYPDVIVDAVRLALADRAEALETADTLRRQLDAHHRHDAATEIDKGGAMYYAGMRDAAALAPEETIEAVRAAAAERILAYAAEEKSRVNDTYGQVYLSGLETAAALIVDGEDDGADIDTDSPFLPASQARAETHLIKVALNHIDAGHDPRGVLHFNDRPLAARVVAAIMADTGAAAAERIRAAAEACEEETRSMFTDREVDAEGYLAGLHDAARIAANETAEADPNVAHIDTVNGRAPAADEAPDDMPVVTPGSFLEAVLNTGGTVVVDDDGVPHATDITIGNDPAAVGTIITADGKRHRFTGGTASPVDDHVIVVAEGGYGSAGAPDDDNPPPRIVLSENGYVLHVMEADDEDAPDER